MFRVKEPKNSRVSSLFSLLNPEDGDTKILRNAGKYLPV
jgi:hypothetical protein